MNDKPLTDRQSELLRWITKYFQREGRTPTMQELSDHFSISRTTAFKIVEPLIDKGYLRKVGSGPYRRLEVIDVTGEPLQHLSVPVIGEVAAGTPILAVENRERVVPIDEQLLKRGVKFGLRVKGKSMIDAGILPGDVVFVKPQPSAIKGQIIVARIDEDVTVKTLQSVTASKVTLRPANADYTDIIVPTDQCAIEGIVLGLYREYSTVRNDRN